MIILPKTVAELRRILGDSVYFLSDPAPHLALDELCRRSKANERLREAARTMLDRCNHVSVGKVALSEALAAAPSQEPKADDMARLTRWVESERYGASLPPDAVDAAILIATERGRQYEAAAKDRDAWKAEAKKADAELAELRAKLEAAEQRLTQENDQGADQIAAALCSTADKCGRTPSMLAGHVQREHEAHTRKFNQFIKVRDELEVVKRDLAAARADLAAARAAQRAVAVEELRKLHDELRGYAVDCERPSVVSVSGDSPKCRAWAYRLVMDRIDDRIAALTAPAAEPVMRLPSSFDFLRDELTNQRDALLAAATGVGSFGIDELLAEVGIVQRQLSAVDQVDGMSPWLCEQLAELLGSAIRRVKEPT